jgi:thioredoxin reductase (NADPH)
MGNDDSSIEGTYDVQDIIIIGGGPSGLSAAVYAARGRMKTLILDKNPSAGALGRADKIVNYPGIPKVIKGSELISQMSKQATSFGAKIVRATVSGVNLETSPFEIITPDRKYLTKTIIIATGNMARKPSIQGEAEFLGKGVSYCSDCDAPFFTDKDVAIAGNVGVIIDELENILKFARKVYVISPEKTLSADVYENLPREEKIELHLDRRILEIRGEETVTGITVVGPGKETRDIDLSGVFVYLHGNRPVVDFLFGSVPTSPDECIIVNREEMLTDIEGVYAAGDVTCKKIRQVVIAAAEGCVAALSAERYLRRREYVSFHASRSIQGAPGVGKTI